MKKMKGKKRWKDMNYEERKEHQREKVLRFKEKNWRLVNDRNNAYCKRRRKTKEFKEYIKNYRKKHLREYNCRNKFTIAVLKNKIKREPCVECGNPKAEGHHPDYSKPYNVIWLCKKHHTEIHKNKTS